ncbi:jg5901 [Pararge aegeria aegeria]|uniref:Jg5901 protein n=1 Tax=Pararge aegeria aegeria TaxID=348720 RepID=A0A8S4RGM0_9NEOP|nr:jg5901 [Pararge aegeria aegeria]
MWPQPPYGVLGDIGGQLLAGASEEEHTDNTVYFPDPCWYFVPEDYSRTAALVVSKPDPFREAHLVTK